MSFTRYPRYKASGVEWLGEVPEHWRVQRLKRMATAFPSNVDKKSAEGEVPIHLCNYTDVYYNDRIVEGTEFMEATATREQIEKFSLRFDDVIITKDSETADDIAVAAYVPADLPGIVCGYHLSLIRPKLGASGAFIKWLFGSAYARSSFEVRANGLTRVGIGQYTVDNIELPVPPYREQLQITAFVDRETARIDALVVDQERLIDLLREKRQAVISHAVTKGFDSTLPMKDSGVGWLGEVPGHWEIVQVKHLADEGTKTFTDGDWIEAPYITEEGIRLIQTGNIGIGIYKEQGYRYISERTFLELRCTEVRPGDVLVCRLDGPVGRACLAPAFDCQMITSVDNAILKVRCGVNAAFVVAILSSVQWLRWLEVVCRVGGGFRLRVSRSQLGEQRVPLPPIEEQQAIVRHIETETSRIDALIAEAERAIALLQERRSALISAAVTGQIDVRRLVPEVSA